MHWKTAGLIIFWLTLLITISWSLLGQQLIAACFFLGGLALTAQAFIASKAEEAFPFKKHKTKMGIFSCVFSSPGTGAFDKISLKVDALEFKKPFELKIHAKKIIWNAKKKAEKNRKAFSKLVGLVEADIDKKKAVVLFKDEPNIRKSIADTLKLLEKIWK